MGEIFRDQGDSRDLSNLLGISEDEVLDRIRQNPARLWGDIQSVADRGGRGVIAKMFHYHASAHQEVWQKFRDENKVIHLVRRNPFNSYVSLQIAQETDVWKVTDANKKMTSQISLTLDPIDAESYIEECHDCVRGVREYFKDADFHEVFYEDISASPEIGVKKVAEIFESEGPEEVDHFGLKRQNTIPHCERITNYSLVSHLDRAVF